MIALRFYRIYDIGREIDLNLLERELTKDYLHARTSFLRVKPKSIMIEEPPLTIQLNSIHLERGNKPFDFTVIARAYDFGVISFCFVYESMDADIATLEEIALLFAGQEGLTESFLQCLRTLGEIVKPYTKDFSIDPEFFEDYTIYVTNRISGSIDPVTMLIGERANVSPQMREEITKNTLSYSMNDLAILSWDSAFLSNPDPSTDLIDLIEYANVQVLELRFYDRILTRRMEKMYDDIGHAERLWWFRRMRQYHAIMAKQMETYAEISEIIEKVNNLIKVTEDIYYARIYATVLKVLRSHQWSESVSRKTEVILENYSMLSDEVRIQHSNFLEWVIIILIALEFGLAISHIQ